MVFSNDVEAGSGLEYFLRWQVAVCALIIFLPTIGAFVLLSRLQKPHLNSSDLWLPCWRNLNPVWLLIYRALVVSCMSWLLYEVTILYGVPIFFFYTQWTFTLVIAYFALGTIISAHGCWKYLKTAVVENEEDNVKERAGFWGYLMLIVYQTCAGAVMLTDIVFWGLLLPFQSEGQFVLTLLIGCMHGVNLLFLLLDTALNNLPFPWFRMAYFVFWSCTYIIFQWTLHARGISWWPYAFLELSTPWAPVWYLAIALIHIPCYGFYVLVVKLKISLFSKLFPRMMRGSIEARDCEPYREAWFCSRE
ncbi:transmembrane protein [Thalictrum thalictroides]|uniref:Transmembrane protein n=1 Tax=Thalictrum thalictroides TaxID=46969 RepID=A0A7J6UY41_THATH|nr:transmembrane protein [Thalictrum thalictroides]